MTGPRMVAACLPVDTSGLPALPPDIPLPVPLVDDTIKTCGRCHQQVWVGPKKLLLAELGQAEIMCYLCALLAVAGAPATVVDLDPGRDEQPRRDGPPRRAERALRRVDLSSMPTAVAAQLKAACHIRDVAQIFRILQRNGWSQRQIAASTGQSQSEISEILAGRRVVSYDVLVRIAEGLGLPRHWLGLAYAEPADQPPHPDVTP